MYYLVMAIQIAFLICYLVSIVWIFMRARALKASVFWWTLGALLLFPVSVVLWYAIKEEDWSLPGHTG
jgi:hypothetical protein